MCTSDWCAFYSSHTRAYIHTTYDPDVQESPWAGVQGLAESRYTQDGQPYYQRRGPLTSNILTSHLPWAKAGISTEGNIMCKLYVLDKTNAGPNVFVILPQQMGNWRHKLQFKIWVIKPLFLRGKLNKYCFYGSEASAGIQLGKSYSLQHMTYLRDLKSLNSRLPKLRHYPVFGSQFFLYFTL